MKRFLGAALAVSVVCATSGSSRADEKEATAILDKAIKALGGEENLTKAKIISVKTKGILTIMGNDADFTAKAIHDGIDRMRSEFQTRLGDNDVKFVAVVDGDKGWGKFGDMDVELNADQLKDEKRRTYLGLAFSISVLKGKGFKFETAGEEKVGDKPAAVLKGTGPDQKDFKLFFDKESGLPVKQVATVPEFGGNGEFVQETTYENYKDFDGIKRPTKVEAKHDGEKMLSSELVEFKVLDKVEPETFSQPK
jgi:hypothetical protein